MPGRSRPPTAWFHWTGISPWLHRRLSSRAITNCRMLISQTRATDYSASVPRIDLVPPSSHDGQTFRNKQSVGF
jgi:hypothetical protein